MPASRPARRRVRARAAVRTRTTVLARTAVLTLLLVATVAGCGDAGELRSAGATPTAVSPARLWPRLPAASSPAWDFDEAETETVEGVSVPGDDIRKADPVAVVRAEIAAHPDDYSGDKAPYRETARRMDECADKGGDGRCPLLEPYYRDLTGDGRDDMTLGFRLPPTNQTAVRVYTVIGHRLVQVMANNDAVSGVELAGRSVIIRSPSDLAGYEYRLEWTWDADQRAMLLTHDEMLRTAGRDRRGRPSSSASPSSTSSASSSPSPSSPASGR
ncbi:lipoprotein [Streptomyces fumigatiscleroticus]|nr:lipoprotein [Streptomyces fumigatiscleroticus]